VSTNHHLTPPPPWKRAAPALSQSSAPGGALRVAQKMFRRVFPTPVICKIIQIPTSLVIEIYVHGLEVPKTYHHGPLPLSPKQETGVMLVNGVCELGPS
jgi:hypothetical protein